MLDNEPELVQELLEKGNLSELERLVDNQMYQAHLYEKKLQGRGLSKPEAQDESVRAVLAPAREWDQNPPVPLSDKTRTGCGRALDRMEEIEERRSGRGQ